MGRLARRAGLITSGCAWEGRMLLAPAGPMPEEVWLVSPGVSACRYRRRAGDRDRPQLRVLRYEQGDGPGPSAAA